MKIGEDGTAVKDELVGEVSIDRVVDVSKIEKHEKTPPIEPEHEQIQETANETVVEEIQETANETVVEELAQTSEPQPNVGASVQTQVVTKIETETPTPVEVSENEKIEKGISILYEANLIAAAPNVEPETNPVDEFTSKGGTSIEAQPILEEKVSEAGVGETQILENEIVEVPEDVTSKYEHFVLAPDYSGFRVEALSSYTELTADHPIFTDFGSVTIEKRPDGRFSYLLGDFTNDRIAVYFLNNAVIDLYPTARLVKFDKGQRQ